MSGDDGRLDRAALSGPQRLRLYYGDLIAWNRALFRWSLTGEGERPSFLPPSPRRLTRGYWRGRQDTLERPVRGGQPEGEDCQP